nr:MAG TPA: hypothetical protein [Caudoviricetes sp.]
MTTYRFGSLCLQSIIIPSGFPDNPFLVYHFLL